MENEKQAGAALVEELRRGCVGGELVREILFNAVYNSAEAGLFLHRSPRWVGKMCATGRISAVKCGGWLIRGAALLAFIQGRRGDE